MKYLKFKYLLSFIKVIIFKLRYLTRFQLVGLKYYLGKNVSIDIFRDSLLRFMGKVYLSDNCTISCSGMIKIGYNTFFNRDCKLVSMEEIEIGDNCLFGPNVGVYDHNHRFDNPEELICKQGFNIKKIKIGSDVWIGANSVITAGVTIGDRVVVGANSVVTKDLESNGLYAGNPVKLIKKI